MDITSLHDGGSDATISKNTMTEMLLKLLKAAKGRWECECIPPDFPKSKYEEVISVGCRHDDALYDTIEEVEEFLER